LADRWDQSGGAVHVCTKSLACGAIYFFMDQRLRCGPEGGCEDGPCGPSPQKVHVEAWVDRLTGGSSAAYRGWDFLDFVMVPG